MSAHSPVMFTIYSTAPWTLDPGEGAAWLELPLGRAACNPNITCIIRTPITTNKFEPNSCLIPRRNVKYFEIWTVFIDFVNDDNLFRIVMIEKYLPTTSSYSAWVFLAVTLRLHWDSWINTEVMLTAGLHLHVSSWLWDSLGDMKPLRPLIIG